MKPVIERYSFSVILTIVLMLALYACEKLDFNGITKSNIENFHARLCEVLLAEFKDQCIGAVL